MDERRFRNPSISASSQKRNAENPSGTSRTKRAKYTSAACNECKRCKVKCIRLDDDPNCQRCAAMQIPCVFLHTIIRDKQKENREVSGDRRYEQLSDEMALLRQQVTALAKTVESLESRLDWSPAPLSVADSTTRVNRRTPLPRSAQPREPQSVGPTRSAFSFKIGHNALNRMSVSTDQPMPTGQSSNTSSREPTPGPSLETTVETLDPEIDCLLSFSDVEIVRLIGACQDEAISCHPIIDTELLARNVPHILELVRNSHRQKINSTKIDIRDVHILRIVVATSITTEPQGKKDVCARLIAAVEQDVEIISSTSEVEIKDIQIMAMLSIYFCHVGEESFSWRAVGRAARQCLEMGLHRKQSIINKFKDPAARKYATQIFWVIYQLDRRWSFGTGLSFALDDREIDVEMPGPDPLYPYFNCIVTYARLCSEIWEALPPYGSPSQLMSKEMESYLDFITENWLRSIPEEIQFQHPRPGHPPKPQPRILHRLGTLFHLRGNYLRLLIHRKHVLNPEYINASPDNARQIVDVAKDSIEVLVHLNRTSDIYVRQQAIYHSYLLSGLGIMILAVCHAPSMFAEECRDSFGEAVELVKGFSRHSSASRRLWKSIRGLLPIIKSLGGAGQRDAAPAKIANGITRSVAEHSESWQQGQLQDGNVGDPSVAAPDLWSDNSAFNGDFSGSIPNVFDLSNDLMDLYNAFGSTGMPMQSDAASGNLNGKGAAGWEMDEISGHIWALI